MRADPEALEELLDALLRSVDAAPLPMWRAEVSRCLQAATGADAVELEWPGGGAEPGRATLEPPGPGVRAGWLRRLLAGARHDGVVVGSGPQGSAAALVVRPPEGAAVSLGVLHRSEDGGAAAASGELLDALLPAFRTAVLQRSRVAAERTALARAVDRLTQEVLLCNGAGRPLHVNPALSHALAHPAGRARLGAMEHLARSLVRGREAPRERPERLEREVEVEAGSFRLRASLLTGGGSGSGGEILVTAAPIRDAALDVAALRERFGLTPRQAEAARLLAAGRSNREIASRLGVSPFTAQKHVRAVLKALGLRARSGVRATLLAGDPPSSAPA